MRWQRGTRSSDVEDRRGVRARRGVQAGIGGLIVLLVAVLFGPEAAQMLGDVTGGGAPSSQQPAPEPIPPELDPDRELVELVNWVHEDLKRTWTAQFRGLGRAYQHPTLVLFTDAVDTACGFSTAAIGPFYCPADRKAYIDLSFYRAMADELDAPGDFAQAYVLAHEVGHHVQNLLGLSERRRDNDSSVRLELQADCFAGIWGHGTARRDLLDDTDIEEGLRAAAAIGDDRLQKRAGQRVNPETFTHGTSAQRIRWFRRGLDTGSVAACDTFAAREL